MSRIPAIFPRKWLSRISETLISITSAIVFFFLDIFDAIMCVFFRILDEFLEGKSSSCYCMKKELIERGENNEDFPGLDEASELSESLHGRNNVFSEIGLRRISRIRSEESVFCVGKGNRWSDCGCESCVSWMNNNGSDSRLHVVVKEQQKGLEKNPEETTVQNVIFVHGFLSSSSLWQETVFPNLSKDLKWNYRLFAVDLLGFGRSPKPRDCLYTLKDHLEMIEKSVIVPFQVNSFHLVAHSMGCVIALALAARYSKSVKSITLIAPPYFSSSKGDASSVALKKLATRRVWPLLLFGSAFMSWYEHLGRCVCFLICRNHKTWEWILKRLTRKRDLHFAIMDLTRHTHHSAWHTMHNVVCGGVKFLDKYLDALRDAGVKIHVVQGTGDRVVPPECSYNMKMKAPEIELEIIPNADHRSVILGREKKICRDLGSLWASTGKEVAEEMQK
ncbi:hypothetical protein BUALT_Bualt16G0104200 [Buddleja alternifolia]|uniref:AB hydrolase-1 domain-containing protein n=1 Tax=Buddleja alternifolia TaxID=168488 RepID=A0AAV6WAP4_9LAMI|nr:hypothetical protein BUALT_Bualt16G0104200 [Buddleja alternifolia]